MYDTSPTSQTELNKTITTHEASKSLCRSEPHDVAKDAKCSIKDSEETYNNGAYSFLAITAAIIGR